MDPNLETVKKIVSQTFKISGYSIKSDTAVFLAQQLLHFSAADRKSWLVTIIGNVQNQGLETPNIEKHHIELAIKQCDHAESNEPTFSVIAAFDVPKFVYHNERKKFIRNSTSKSFLPKATAKADYIRDRYALLWQRTIRHELFSATNTLDGNPMATQDNYKLSKVEILLSTSKPIEVVVLGYLTQLTEGKFHLEDPTGTVELDLSKAKFHSGLFCEGCFVLADGRFVDGVLRVNGIGFPPPESAANSRAYFGTANTWGGPSKTLLKYSTKLAEIEKANLDGTIAFLSDCWLDNPTVMEKLKVLFTGYDEFPPIAIVMMGQFAKRTEDPYALKAKLSALGNLLGSCEQLKKSTDLVLVPATEDPSATNVLPRPAIPEFLAADLKKQFPRLILATNPCRLQYCTQQIAVCRSDLITKFCRNTIKFPKDGMLEEHFARTLITQATLSPLHPIAQPVFWQHDAALSLYPLPDLIVIGDPSKGFQTTFRDCTVMNTGSFSKSKFAFKVYVPANRSVEDSQVPDVD